jgi:hypothetical protein
MNFSKSESGSLNTTYRSKKFFLCIHQAPKGCIGFEKSEERFTQFTYLEYGYGRFYVIKDGNVIQKEGGGSGILFNLKDYVNSHVVCESLENSKFISFNPWRKDGNWTARLIEKNERIISSNASYSCIVCLRGSCIVNGNNFAQYDYSDLKQNVEYSIDILENSDVGLFELCQ